MRVAINGLGRIGRAVFKLLVATPELKVAAVNEVAWPRSFPWNWHSLLGSRVLSAGHAQASTQIPCDA